MTQPMKSADMAIGDSNASAKRARRLVYNILIFAALGIGFGKIVSVESVPDRAIQNFRLQQIPKTLETKAKELTDKGVEGDRFNKEMDRVYKALLADANKARPTLCANDRSRWATIRALVEPDARVYRYVPVFTDVQKEKRVDELNRKNPDSCGTLGFKYYPNEILRNCEADCPEKFCDANRVAKKYTKQLVPYAVDKVWETPGWDSIDVVKHGLKDEAYQPENPSSGYIYSSKPTLLPTVMAAPYWIVNRWFGLSLADKPFETARLLLVIYNLIPLGIAFFCLTSLIESVGKTDWGKFFAAASLLFASFTLTFVATLNNHIPGVACISIALWAGMKIMREGKTSWIYFALAGFFGAFSVACDLPSLAFAGLLCVLLLLTNVKKTALVSVPFGLVVAVAFFTTDLIAHQSLTPAYAHKRDHMELAAQLEDSAKTPDSKKSSEDAASEDPVKQAATKAADKNNAAKAEVAPQFDFDPNDWYYYVYYPSGKPRELKHARLSHWANRTGIDKGEPSIKRYAFHSTIGMRGVFSLVPVWIFSVAGAFVMLRKKYSRNKLAAKDSVEQNEARQDGAEQNGSANQALQAEPGDRGLREFGFMTLLLTLVFFAFFMTRDQGDRNYGGVSCYPRWFFPLIPLFVPAMTPFVDALAKSRWGRGLAYLALFVAAASASYPTWSPWVSPWLYQLAVDWNWTTPY